MMDAGLPHGGKNRQRHRKLPRAGEVHHQHREGAGRVAGEQIGNGAACQGIRHQLIRQMRGLVLRRGLEFLRLLDHGNDLVVPASAALFLHAENTLALFHHRACIHSGTGPAGHRDGFAGEGRLVDHDIALVDHAVQRDHAAHMHGNAVAGAHLAQGQLHFAVVRLDPDPVNVQGHTAGQIFHRLFMGPLFQQFAQPQQEHHRTGGAEIAPCHGNAHGQAIQQLHMQLPPPQAAHRPAQIGQRAAQRPHHAQWRREEHIPHCLAADHAHQFFLILPVGGTAGVGHHQLCGLLTLIREAVQCLQHGGAAALFIIDDRAAGALMHRGLVHCIQPLQPGSHQVGLIQRHTALGQLHPDAASAFMFD